MLSYQGEHAHENTSFTYYVSFLSYPCTPPWRRQIVNQVKTRPPLREAFPLADSRWKLMGSRPGLSKASRAD